MVSILHSPVVEERHDDMATGWIYILGEVTGKDLKIGYTSEPKLIKRAEGINRDQTTNDKYVVLAGVRGTPNDERVALRYFTRAEKGSRTEYIEPTPEAVEWVNWLRSQHFATPDGQDDGDSFFVVESSLWLPTLNRRIPLAQSDPSKMIQDFDVRGPLAGTAWAAMINPMVSFQDYFTPKEIVQAARTAMGGIDLDAASHRAANVVHQIPHYFHVNNSAFDNRWFGNVWLNPPYGDNAPWFREIERYVKSGDIEQLCMLSPMWTFITGIARPVMKLSSAFLLLSPTPSFWGNSEGRTGRNDPHGIMYIGDNPHRFLSAFREFGLPLLFPWETIDALTVTPVGVAGVV